MQLSAGRPIAVVAALLCFPLAAAAALIVPVSQTRSVSASAQKPSGAPVTSSFSAGDFGPFDQTASATATDNNGFVTSTVRQTSSIGESSISSMLQGFFTHQLGGAASTQSIFDVTFDLTAPASYQLGNGQVAYAFGYGTHAVTLRDANGQVIAQPPLGYYYPFDSPVLGPAWVSVSSGVLAPGRYRMTAQWDRGTPGDPGSWYAGAVLSLTAVPEPGSALLLALGLGALAARRARTES
jgi:hypothetical protein